MQYLARWFLLVGFLVAVAVPGLAQSCPGDFDGDNQVTVDELLQSVDRALLGCPAPLVLGGPFDGGGVASRTACADPNDVDAILLEDMTITVLQQQGGRFTARLDAFDQEGHDVSLNLAGSIDAAGFVRGTVHDDAGEVSGSMTGGLAGEGLSLAFLLVEPLRSCSVAGAVLGVRR